MFTARMERLILLTIALALAATYAVVPAQVAPRPPDATAPPIAALPISVSGPTWPPSTGLVIGEVVTRGAAASDQYVEIYNAAAGPLSLAALELAYVTASGASVSRKQSWTELVLPAYHHLLIANAAGAYVALADGSFSGGFSTTGGTVVLRTAGGAVIDALSWGTAANSFAEGAAAPAPPTGSGLERLPGGGMGNGYDTNDNVADTRLQSAPQPQALASGPSGASPTAGQSATPGATATETPPPAETDAPPFEDDLPGDPEDEVGEPTPSAAPTPADTPTLAPQATLPETTTATATPTASATSTASAAATTAPTWPASPPAPPTPTPTPTQIPSPTPSPTPTPTPNASPSPQPLASTRQLPLGTQVTIQGWLTTPPGLTESGKGAFVEDGTAGIALYLAAGVWPSASIGDRVTVRGALESRFSLLTVRVASAADVLVADPVDLPQPLLVATGQVNEAVEGRLVAVEAVVSETISSLADGYSTAVDDGTGSVRVIVAAAAEIDRAELVRGRSVRLTGVVGQRDTSGTGASGYRLHLRGPVDVLGLEPEPTAAPTMPSGPTPSPTPLPSATPRPSSAPAPTPTPSPTAAPTAAPTAIPIAQARSRAVGERVLIEGVVTARPGRILGDRTLCLQDASAGICVRMPAGASAVTGDVLRVEGPLAAPYDNLEVRPLAGGVTIIGSSALPAARLLAMAELGEATEGILALVRGTVTSISASSAGALTVMLQDASGEGRIYVHAALGMSREDFARGRQMSVYGIVGDRLGLYRLWPRDDGDFVSVAQPTPTPTPAPGASFGPGPAPGPGATASPSVSSPAPGAVSIREALRRAGQRVIIEGVVSAPANLLDADGRRVTVQDAEAAILLRLPSGAPMPAVGQRIRASGEVGTYYGAPQLAAAEAPALLGAGRLEAMRVTSAPLPASAEWRLVTVSGTVESLQRSGDSWRAEIATQGGGVPVVGLARSGIPSDALVKGRLATVTGLVRRAYPTASDQRFAVVPRGPADVSLGGAAGVSGSPDPLNPGPLGGSFDPASSMAPGPSLPPLAGPDFGLGLPAVALSELAGRVGQRVRIGGRIERVLGERLMVNDGTASAPIAIGPAARPLLSSLRAGMLVNVIGTVVRLHDDGLAVLLEDPADLVLGALRPASVPSAPPVGSPGLTAAPVAPAEPASGAPTGSETLPLIVGLLAVLGAVTGTATAFFARRAGPRGLREAIERWRRRLVRGGRP